MRNFWESLLSSDTFSTVCLFQSSNHDSTAQTIYSLIYTLYIEYNDVVYKDHASESEKNIMHHEIFLHKLTYWLWVHAQALFFFLAVSIYIKQWIRLILICMFLCNLRSKIRPSACFTGDGDYVESNKYCSATFVYACQRAAQSKSLKNCGSRISQQAIACSLLKTPKQNYLQGSDAVGDMKSLLISFIFRYQRLDLDINVPPFLDSCFAFEAGKATFFLPESRTLVERFGVRSSGLYIIWRKAEVFWWRWGVWPARNRFHGGKPFEMTCCFYQICDYLVVEQLMWDHGIRVKVIKTCSWLSMCFSLFNQLPRHHASRWEPLWWTSQNYKI